MNTLRIALLAMSLAMTATACGGDDKDSSSQTPATSGSTGSTASTGTCDPISTSSAQSDADGKSCPAMVNCMKTSCATALGSCYGTNFSKGDYSGGTCETYLTCIKTCNCEKACTDKCEPSMDCASCMMTGAMSCTLGACLSAAMTCGS